MSLVNLGDERNNQTGDDTVDGEVQRLVDSEGEWMDIAMFYFVTGWLDFMLRAYPVSSLFINTP